jgi:hypothetical protein
MEVPDRSSRSGGGLIQFTKVGQIDNYFIGNPQISFYQYAYKRHTQFAMESISLDFSTVSPVMSSRTTLNTYTCTISRYGDLLSNLYFCFTLPDIYSSSKYKFRWIKNIGTIFLKKASIYLNGTMIDQTTGEWMNVWNELTLPAGDTQIDQMIGNDTELQDPKASYARLVVKNNKFIYFYYPDTSKDIPEEPSIKGRQIIVPLNFWFTRNSALALPLLKLGASILKLNLELESSESLYQVFSDKLNMYVSPTYYNELHGDKININSFTIQKKDIDIKPYIEANYIFLGNAERDVLIKQLPVMSYVVEQLAISKTNNVNSKSTNHNFNIIINNPTKEIIWTLKRNDLWKFNDYFNYSVDIPESKNAALEKATIRLSDYDRFGEKNAEYFNMIQPYQHHTKIPKQGIYSYSFAIHPEKEYITGYYNAALFQTTLNIVSKNTYDNKFINNLLIKTGKEPYEFDYNLEVFVLNYNIFEVQGGIGAMKFTTST